MEKRRGFTFIEIMVVVVILAILGALMMPRIKGTYRKARMKKTAREVVGLLRYARDLAVLTEQSCEIHFDVEKDMYKLVMFDEEGEPIEFQKRRRRRFEDEGGPLAGSVEMTRERYLDDRVHFAVIYSGAELSEDDLPRIIYYPDGSATPATLGIQDEGDMTISVEVYRTTGMPRVEEGLPVEKPNLQKLYYGPGG